MNNAVLACLVAVLLVSCTKKNEETPTRGSLSMAACESQFVLLQREAQEFQRIYTETSVIVVERSTREAIVALLNDSLKMICTDRPLNAEERAVVQRAQLPLVETKIAEDALAVIVHTTNPMKEIGFSSLGKIFRGDVHSWSQIPESHWSGSIDAVLTGRNSGTYELLATSFLKTTLTPAHSARSQQEIVRYVAQTPHAIGIVTISAIRDSVPTIKAVAVQAVNKEAPTPFVKLHQANVYRDYYPLHYPVYVYSTAKLSSVVSGFTSYIASVPGQKIFQNAGLVPATMPVRLVQITRE
jgi:phosphate transport system substrate-binding protein